MGPPAPAPARSDPLPPPRSAHPGPAVPGGHLGAPPAPLHLPVLDHDVPGALRDTASAWAPPPPAARPARPGPAPPHRADQLLLGLARALLARRSRLLLGIAGGAHGPAPGGGARHRMRGDPAAASSGPAGCDALPGQPGPARPADTGCVLGGLGRLPARPEGAAAAPRCPPRVMSSPGTEAGPPQCQRLKLALSRPRGTCRGWSWTRVASGPETRVPAAGVNDSVSMSLYSLYKFP